MIQRQDAIRCGRVGRRGGIGPGTRRVPVNLGGQSVNIPVDVVDLNAPDASENEKDGDDDWVSES